VTGGNTFDNGTDYWNWIVYWFVKRQQKKIEEEVYKTPIEKTLKLRTKGLWQKGVKAYYSELTDIARNYIEEAIDIPYGKYLRLITGLRAALSDRFARYDSELGARFKTSRFSEIC
jgi:hypothetical protein